MNKINVTLLALAGALALSACGGPADPAASSSAGLPQGNVEAGRTLANAKGTATGQACVDCHGADGNTPLDGTYPKLGGQYADYLAYALQSYRDGKRAGTGTTDLMATQAKDLTDQQIADLAAFFGSQKGDLRDLHGAY